MSLHRIIALCDQLGIRIRLYADNLKLSERPPAGLEALIKAEKPLLIQYLRALAVSSRFEKVIKSANRALRGEISADEHFSDMDRGDDDE